MRSVQRECGAVLLLFLLLEEFGIIKGLEYAVQGVVFQLTMIGEFICRKRRVNVICWKASLLNQFRCEPVSLFERILSDIVVQRRNPLVDSVSVSSAIVLCFSFHNVQLVDEGRLIDVKPH